MQPRWLLTAALAALVALGAFATHRHLELRERADGGPGHGLELRIGDLDALREAPIFEGVDQTPGLAQIEALGLADGAHRLYAHWQGWLRADRDGIYELATVSDDGSRLSLDGNWIVQNGGAHKAQRRSGQVWLLAGWHPLRVDYTQEGGPLALEVIWDPPGLPEETIPPRHLYATAPSPMALWWIEHVAEPLAPHAREVRGLAFAAALGALLFATLGLRRASGLARAARVVPAALVSVLWGTVTRRRASLLAGLFLACAFGWVESDAAAGGFRSAYRSPTTTPPGPWLALPVDPDASSDARVAASEARLAPRVEQIWEGWLIVREPGFHWFAAQGDAPFEVAIDERFFLSHPGDERPDAQSREHLWLARGVHRFFAVANRRDHHTHPAVLTWAPPGERLRRFDPAEVFSERPNAARVRSRVQLLEARPAVRRLGMAGLALVAGALLGTGRRGRPAASGTT